LSDSETEDKQSPEESQNPEDVADSDAAQDVPLEFSREAPEAPEAPEANDVLAEAHREKDQFKRLAQRAQADLVNYRRRIEGEQESSRLRNQQRVVLRFADVIDQLDVALSSGSLEDVDAGWIEGITAIQKNFVNALTSEGFTRFSSIGEQFDPRKHEALLSSPTADHEPNTVIAELRPGYMRNDEVVRPAQVQIAVETPEPGAGDGEGDDE
jgi:molecular chaperone GrpE